MRLIEFVRKAEVLIGREAKDLDFASGDTMILAGKPKETAEFLEQIQAEVQTGGKKVDLPVVSPTEIRLGEAVVLPDSRFAAGDSAPWRCTRDTASRSCPSSAGACTGSRTFGTRSSKRATYCSSRRPSKGFAALRDTEAVLIVEGLDQTIRRQKRVWVAVGIVLAVVFGAALTASRSSSGPWRRRADDRHGACASTRPRGRSTCRSCSCSSARSRSAWPCRTTGVTAGFRAVALETLGDLHPAIILSVLYLFTSVITEFLSNKATAILLAPVALELATQLDVSEQPFLFAICFAASASFMTPFGYPTNLIVMGPGGYRFTDYLRIGVPLNLLIWILASLLIPVIWPFWP